MSRTERQRIAVMIESHFEETEFLSFNRFFPEKGYDLEYISYLWDQPQLTFQGNDLQHSVRVGRCVSRTHPSEYRGLVLIGGYAMDRLRYEEHPMPSGFSQAPAVCFLRQAVDLMDRGELVIGTICHSLWLFCADPALLRGRRVTCAHNIICDVINAGGEVVFENGETKEVVEDGYLVSSRHPGVLDTFLDIFMQKLGKLHAA